MKHFWSRLSIAYKMFLTLLLFVFMGQLIVMFYLWRYESIILFAKERQNLTSELKRQSSTLQKHLSSLAKETRFLASLEMMDDMIAKDLDKRVVTLLQRKAADLGEGIVLLAHDKDTFIASSQSDFTGYVVSDIQKSLHRRYLNFDSTIYASFDKEKSIGSLLMLYPLQNLQNLKIGDGDKKLWLTSPSSLSMFPSLYLDDYIVVSQKLQGILEGWSLYLGYAKSSALMTLKHIEKVILFTFLFSILMLGVVVWFLSKRLTNPIQDLLETSEEIISTKDYSKQVKVSSQDEIGELANSFNTLIQKTDKHIMLLKGTREALDTKSTFLSIISHDLRTPLGSILNLTQHIMISPNINEEQSDMLRRIEISSEHLLSMINNILQLSKLESNSIEVRPKKVNLKVLLEEIFDMVEPLMDEKSLGFHKDILDVEVSTDSHLFKQVLINLLSNAIKFTHKGYISVSLKKKGEYFSLIVSDTGIGIEKQRQHQLFSDFYQASLDMESLKNSSGLGLALSQKVANLLDGSIMIESEGLGKGTKATFIFSEI